MIPLDTFTSFFVTSFITLTISLALLLFSLSQRRYRLFLWAAIANGSLAGAQYFMALRGTISDLSSIVVANALALLYLIFFYEVIRRLFSISSRERLIGPILLAVQTPFLIWFTYYDPNFSVRVIVISLSLCTMTACLLKLLVMHSPKRQRVFYLFAALPFLLFFLFSASRIILFFVNKGIAETSYESASFSFTATFYGTEAVWMTLSVVFIVINKIHAQVKEMALIDPLTGVLNRRALRDFAEREIAKARRTNAPLCLIITDIDHFKNVNDAYGHQAGDAVLSHLVNLYKKILRTEDILARYGGEEFVAVLPNARLDEAVSIAERLRNACKKNALVFGNHRIPITSSYGVASFTDDATEFESIVKQADDALYQAKREGRDRVVALNYPNKPCESDSRHDALAAPCNVPSPNNRHL